MAQIKKLVLDVLKPHKPNALEFAVALADLSSQLKVRLTVAEVDEKTESTIVFIEGGDVDYEAIAERITRLGGSIHSIDEVEVIGTGEASGSS
ncbi:MAG TPA: hypothetical protein EYP34_10310 [Chromatiaceae bacterium]|nr:hypothetical protein [Chromatiaceae bacterium]